MPLNGIAATGPGSPADVTKVSHGGQWHPRTLSRGRRRRPRISAQFNPVQITEYSRLTLGLPRHGTCEQMP
jgi:hypothetical protein